MKVIVAHPAQQHSFRLASALKKAGILDKYFTTVYLKKRNATSFVTKLLNKRHQDRAQGRRCEALDDKEVVQYCEWEGLLKLLALHNRFFKKWYTKLKYHIADRFAKKVAKYAIKHKIDVVVTYDDCSPVLFEILKKKAPHIQCVLDVSAANRLYMKNIYEKDTKLAPAFAKRLMHECHQVWDEKMLDRVEREIRSTDWFLAPSEFVKESLTYSGVKEEQIKICPYGVDAELFAVKSDYTVNKPLRFVYVGGVKELKGIYYLLEAFKNIPKDKAVLTVVGNFNKDDEDIQPYVDYVSFTGLILHSKVPEILRQSDVFVFPSLGEGFALSALEAASCGLPLIVSENAGTKDSMNNHEGFVIPVQSVEAIKERVLWFVENTHSIETMGKAARKMAESFSWDRYSAKVAEIFLNNK